MADSFTVPAAATQDERVFPAPLVAGTNDFASVTETTCWQKKHRLYQLCDICFCNGCQQYPAL